MMVRCEQCGLVQQAPELAEPRCARCGHFLVADAPAAGQVIDVQAEVLSTQHVDEPVSPVYTVEPAWAPPSQPRVYTWSWGQQARGGPGCGSIGCLILILLAFLLLRGCF